MAGTKKSGRKKLPHEKKALMGTLKTGRDEKPASLTHSQEAVRGIPEPSNVLKKNELAYNHFKELGEQLHGLGLLWKVDLGMLEAYCISYSIMVSSYEKVQEMGLTVFNKDGELKPNPNIAIMNKSMAEVKSFGSEFGLSPVKRIQVAAIQRGASTKTDDPMDSF